MRVVRTIIRSRMSMKFCMIRLGTMESAALESPGKYTHRLIIGEMLRTTLSPLVFNGSFLFADEKDNDEFDFRPDSITNYGVSFS